MLKLDVIYTTVDIEAEAQHRELAKMGLDLGNDFVQERSGSVYIDPMLPLLITDYNDPSKPNMSLVSMAGNTYLVKMPLEELLALIKQEKAAVWENPSTYYQR